MNNLIKLSIFNQILFRKRAFALPCSPNIYRNIHAFMQLKLCQVTTLERQSSLYVPILYRRLAAINCFQRSLYSKKMPSAEEEFRHLDYQQLNEVKNKSIVIDVREQKELDETGVIPGAYHIPLGDIERALAVAKPEFKKLYNFDKPSVEDQVIFSCRSGKRSLVALEKALAVGYTNAKHYKGGWLDWENHASGSK